MMKKSIYILLVLLLVSCGSDKTASISSDTAKELSSSKITVQSILSNIDKGKYKEGELLVKFKSGVLTASSLKTHQSLGSAMIKKIPVLDVEHVRLPQGTTVKDAIVKYMEDPNVEYAEPNYILRTSLVPNDTYFNPQQWGLRNTGQFANGTQGDDIKATDAWDISTQNLNITVAVVDTGIDANHPDLFDNVVSGWNFIDNNSNTTDDVGHGTHVAGIIGGVGNNGVGISGVMWRVKLMPVKVCSAEEDCPTDAIANGIIHAVQNGAKVINASLGTFPPGSPSPNTLFNAVNTANNSGVLVVASAGNEANNNDLAPVYPASYILQNIISVAASDQNDRRASFSNFGATVHVAAPGVYILSTITPGLTFSMCTGSAYPGYDFCDGTSMASPYVAGLAGLLHTYYTNFNHLQVRSTILRYVDIRPEFAGWILTGGRINAYESLASLLIPTNLTATANSSSSIALTWSDNARHEDGYKIERTVLGGTYAQVAVTGANATTFTDTGLDSSTTYYYRVRAFNDIGESPDYSNVASATTLAVGTSTGGGGGGGCSIGARQNGVTAASNVVLMLIPLAVIAILRRRK